MFRWKSGRTSLLEVTMTFLFKVWIKYLFNPSFKQLWKQNSDLYLLKVSPWQVSFCCLLWVSNPVYVWQQNYPDRQTGWPAGWSPQEPLGGSPLYWRPHKATGKKQIERVTFPDNLLTGDTLCGKNWQPWDQTTQVFWGGNQDRIQMTRPEPLLFLLLHWRKAVSN